MRYAICMYSIVYTYFDLINISLHFSYLNLSHLSFLRQAWVFIQQFRHIMRCNIFSYGKFWESISDYLINCVYVDFAHGLYFIDALRPTYTKKRSKEENMVSEPRLFYFGKIKSLRLE